MAISENDRHVLQALENDLLGDGQSFSPSRISRRTAGLSMAFAALVIGLLVLFVGLSLAGAVGTCVGVAGSIVFGAGVWLGVENGSPWLIPWITARRQNPKP